MVPMVATMTVDVCTPGCVEAMIDVCVCVWIEWPREEVMREQEATSKG